MTKQKKGQSFRRLPFSTFSSVEEVMRMISRQFTELDGNHIVG